MIKKENNNKLYSKDVNINIFEDITYRSFWNKLLNLETNYFSVNENYREGGFLILICDLYNENVFARIPLFDNVATEKNTIEIPKNYDYEKEVLETINNFILLVEQLITTPVNKRFTKPFKLAFNNYYLSNVPLNKDLNAKCGNHSERFLYRGIEKNCIFASTESKQNPQFL